MDLSTKALSEAELRDVIGGDFVGLGGILVPSVLPNIWLQ